MKKLFFTSALVLLVSFAFSQSLIPKVGVTLSKWSGDDFDDVKSKIGFTLGLGLNLPLGEGAFSIQPELNFIQKGWKFDEDDESEKLTLSYIEIPVLVKATFGEATKFYVNAGPSIGLGAGGKYKYKIDGDSDDFNIRFGEGDDFETIYIETKTDFGLQFGAGIIIAEKVMIDLRYGLGLSSSNAPDFGDAKFKNNVLQFTVGVPINLGK